MYIFYILPFLVSAVLDPKGIYHAIQDVFLLLIMSTPLFLTLPPSSHHRHTKNLLPLASNNDHHTTIPFHYVFLVLIMLHCPIQYYLRKVFLMIKHFTKS